MKTKLPTISFILIALGLVFRVLHWPGAFFLFSLSAIFTVLFTLFEFMNTESNAKSRNIQILSAVMVIICCTGIIFKIYAWPGSNFMIGVGLALAFAVSVLMQFFNPSEYRLSRNLISGIFFILIILLSFFPKHSLKRSIEELNKEIELNQQNTPTEPAH